jgi:hypothetical protein
MKIEVAIVLEMPKALSREPACEVGLGSVAALLVKRLLQ